MDPTKNAPPPYYQGQQGPITAQPDYGQPAPILTHPANFVPQPAPASIQTVTMTRGGYVTTNINIMGAQSQIAVCSSCHQQIVTEIQHKTTFRTHVVAAMMCMLGCIPCMLIPYCTNTCKSLDHYCPSCQAYLGSYMNG